MNKILLIQPVSPETFWKLTGLLDIIKKKSVIPPLGLATVAALTPSHFDVTIIDEAVEEIDFDSHYDIVGITGFTLHAPRIVEIVSQFKKRGILTVGGGPFCSSNPEEASQYFDVVIKGEAEFIWPRFLVDWEAKKHLSFYEETKSINMADSPIPRWNIVNLDNYSASLVQTSRGCPYDCEFCDVISLFGRKTRYKPIDSIITELQYFVNMGRFEVFFTDDNFISNKSYVKKLLRRLIKLNESLKKPLRYMTQLTLNVAQDLELLDLFKRANFFAFFIGIETPNKESLKLTNKEHNLKFDIVDAVRKIQSRGIFIVSGMIVGFDGDNINIFDEQSNFLIEAGITIPMLGMLIASKGTKLWDRLSSEGRLLSNIDGGDMFAQTNFIPKYIKKHDLEFNYIKLLKEVFSYQHFIRRFIKLIDQVNLDEIKNGSPLLALMKPSNFRLYHIGVTYRLIRYFVFTTNRKRRRFFFTILKVALKKSILCLPWVIEHLLYFKAEYQYVLQHDLKYQQNTVDYRTSIEVNKEELILR